MDKTAVTFISLMTAVIVLMSYFIFSRNQGSPTRKMTDEDGSKYNVTMIDGCEYITSYGYYGLPSYAHKGNCTNSIHIYREVK